ncbi:MAG: hypothetical protein VX519_07965 [Myxococcota bacterium]|nr:hypothetical protein [Myxococcota bacterium]
MIQVGVLMLPVLGCSTQSISGDLGGSTPVVVEAVYTVIPSDSGVQYRVLMADFPDVCSRLEAHQGAVQEAQNQLLIAESEEEFIAGAESMEAADAILPETFWLGRLELNSDSSGSSLVGERFAGSAANADVIDGFAVSFSHHRGYTDWSTCSQAWFNDPGGVDICEYRWESWVSHGGEARVLEYVASDELGLEFDAPFRDVEVPSGVVHEEVGSIQGRIWAQSCDGLSSGLGE